MRLTRRLSTSIVTVLTIGLLLNACGSGAKDAKEPEASQAEKQVLTTKLGDSQFVAQVSVWDSAEAIEKDCTVHIDGASGLQETLRAYDASTDNEHPLITYNKLLIELDRVRNLADLIQNVHPQKEVREAAEKCQQRSEKFASSLALDRGLFGVLEQIDKAKLDKDALRFLEHTLRDYERAGVDKDEATRNKLASLQGELVKAGQEFQRNIRDGRKVIEVNPKDLAGLPEDFVKAHKPGANGKVQLSTDYPDLKPVLRYAHSEQVRRDMWKAAATKAYPINDAKLREMLDMRREYATTLGYAHWGDYATEDKMIKNAGAIEAFLDKTAQIARVPMVKEREEMLQRKKQDTPDTKGIRTWDNYYYINKIRAEKFAVDAQKLRPYLAYDKVKAGMLALAQELFKVTFKKSESPVWHHSVDAYEVFIGDEKLGNFYLDMHPREDKYGHAAMFQVYHGVNGAQLPAAALICNFPEPSDDDPGLMEHGQVRTMFHEFGHLMHHILAGRMNWVTFSGVQTEWDFVEVPSQVLEEWVWEVEVLQSFALHHETGEPIPKELVDKLRAANDFGKGVFVTRQLSLSAFSYRFHTIDTSKIGDLNEVVREMTAKYSPFPFEPDSRYYASFGHLEGYTVTYYTYMWSLMLAKDILGRFEEEGFLNPNTVMDYRTKILEKGGSADGADLISDFLGREYSFDAFAKWLSSENLEK